MDLGTSAKVKGFVEPNILWLGPTMILLPLLAFIAWQLFQLLERPPSLKASSEAIAVAFEAVATAHQLEGVLATAKRVQLTQLATNGTGVDDHHRDEHVAGEVTALVATLRDLTANDVQQSQQISRLDEQLAIELDELKAVSEANERKGLGAARRLIQRATGEDTTLRVGEAINSIIASENVRIGQHLARLAEDTRKATGAAREQGVVVIGLTLAGVLFTVLACRRLAQSERARRAVEWHQRRSLEEARSALEQSQKMQVLGRLAAHIGHDFNNLLLVIRTDIELLQECLEGADARVQRYLDTAKRSTDRAARVMKRLLRFSRQQPTDQRTIEVNPLVREMAELLSHVLSGGVSVRTVLGDDVGMALVDPDGLETSILNLAINARDAMGSCGDLTIETSSTFLDEAYASSHAGVTAGRYILIAMSDTGVGMSSDVIARACDPFFTTKGMEEGTGLGLSQVRDFVRQAQGHLAIESELQVGTTVRLYLPYVA